MKESNKVNGGSDRWLLVEMEVIHSRAKGVILLELYERSEALGVDACNI